VRTRVLAALRGRAGRRRASRAVPRLIQPQHHEGATESFGRELRALRHVELSPELVTTTETDLRWGLLWYEFEKTMQAEIDRVFAPYLPVAECRDFDDLRALIGLRETAWSVGPPRS